MSAVAALGYSLLQTGQHHGEEVPQDAPGTWLALSFEKGVTTLEPVQVEVRAVHDEVLDRDESAKSGREVVVVGAAPGGYHLLLRGPGLVPGPVREVETKPRPLFPGDHQWLVLGDQQLEVFGVGAADDTGRLETFGLFAPPTTLLAKQPMAIETGGGPPSVFFAGDIDRDGLIDVLVSTGTHYNVRETTLFLSGPEGEELVPVAVYRTVGC